MYLDPPNEPSDSEYEAAAEYLGKPLHLVTMDDLYDYREACLYEEADRD